MTVDEKAKIRAFIEVFYDSQDLRIRSFNRLRQIGDIQGVEPEHLKLLEKQIRDYIATEIKDYPIVKNFLRGIRGIGPILAGGLVSFFDVYKADHASSFWSYAGLSVEDGKAVKRRRGEKTKFNPMAKVLMWKIGDSFIKHRTPFYRDIYDQAKIQENIKLGNCLANPENCPNYQDCVKRLKKATKPPCKMHIHLRAMRKMVKRFLSDYWAAWRATEGLSVSKPYSHRLEP